MTLSPLHLVVNWPDFTIYLKYFLAPVLHDVVHHVHLRIRSWRRTAAAHPLRVIHWMKN